MRHFCVIFAALSHLLIRVSSWRKKFIEMLLYARQILLMIICGAGGSKWKFRMCETIEPLDGEKEMMSFDSSKKWKQIQINTNI